MILPPGYSPPTATGLTGEPDDVVARIGLVDPPATSPDDIHSARHGKTLAPQSARERPRGRQVQPRPLRPVVEDPADRPAAGHRRQLAPERVPLPDGFRGDADVMILRDGGTVNLDSIGAWYSTLDRPGNDVRIRLNCTATRCSRAAATSLAEITYLTPDRKDAERVRARRVVMACWNRVTARIVTDLPQDQVENLCYARKVPLIYGRAVLNNWQAWADAKVSSIQPRGTSLFWDSTSISAGAGFGSPGAPVYGPTPNQPPASPASLTFTVVPNRPDAIPQLYAYESGRDMLLNMSFADLEHALWDVIDRVVNTQGGDFQPERDVSSIMINRWNYGYAHGLTSVFDPSLHGPWAEQPQRKGCVPFANVAIACSDSEGFAYTHSAINEGFRAVNDLPGSEAQLTP